MKKNYSLLLALFLVFPFFLHAQCGDLYDDFESSAVNPQWILSGHSATNTTTNPAVGTRSLEIVGSSGHYLGLKATFQPAQPNYVSWWAKSSSTSIHDGYMVIGDANTGNGNNGVCFSYFQNTGILRVIGNATYQIPYTANTWYFFELKNIDYVTKTFDIWIDGTFRQSMGFRTATSSDINQVNLYNWQSSTSWFDEIVIGGSNITTSFAPVNPACNGDSSGTATLTTSGGTGALSYFWSNGDTTPTVSGLAAGWYSVDITDSLGCTVTDSVQLTEPTSLTDTLSFSDVTCPGGSDGAAAIAVSGGTPGYTYLWSNGDTTQSLSAIGAGVYSVQVLDSNGCEILDTATVTAPPAFATNHTVSPILCAGDTNGNIDLGITGGTGPYTISWNTGDTTESLNNLGPGTYVYNAVDSLGCVITPDSATLDDPAPLATAGSVTDESNGQMDGAIDLSVSGGTPGFSFSWVGPGSFSSTNEDISGLEAGEYIVLVTDSNGCSSTDTFTVNNIVGIASAFSSEQLKVSPNPFRAGFTLSFNSGSVGMLSLELQDITGKQLQSLPAIPVNGEFTYRWEPEALAPGMYFLRAKFNDQIVTLRVIKQ